MLLKNFYVTEEQAALWDKIPHGVNMSEELRKCLDKVLAKYAVKP